MVVWSPDNNWDDSPVWHRRLKYHIASALCPDRDSHCQLAGLCWWQLRAQVGHSFVWGHLWVMLLRDSKVTMGQGKNGKEDGVYGQGRSARNFSSRLSWICSLGFTKSNHKAKFTGPCSWHMRLMVYHSCSHLGEWTGGPGWTNAFHKNSVFLKRPLVCAL